MLAMEVPPVSVVIPTLNSSRTLESCLTSIRIQEYPQESVEIMLVDGGSNDTTSEIGRHFNCRFIEGGYPHNQEARKSLGLFESREKLVLYVDSDNILPNSNWLRQIVRPMVERPEITAAQTWRYGIKPGFNFFNRYCALIGANDPVAFYLGKSEKQSWLYDDWRICSVKEDYGDYFLVEFDENNLPTLGGNGFLIRRETLLKAHCSREEFFHIDVVLDLVRSGYTLFAMVRHEIFHDTATSLSHLALRRARYFIAHNPLGSSRRYLVFNPRRASDLTKILFFAFQTITVLPLFLLSLKGFRRRRDWAWFWHPLVCWVFFISYSFSTIYILLASLWRKFNLALK